MPDFTCKLKQFRLAKGLTQEQLAEQVHVTKQPFPEAGRGYLPHSRSTDRGDFYF